MVEDNSGGEDKAAVDTQPDSDYVLHSETVATEAAKADAEPEKPEDKATQAESEADGSGKRTPKKPGGYKAKVDYYKGISEQQAARLTELEAKVAKYQPKPDTVKLEDSGEPSETDFDNVLDYLKAHQKWTAKQEVKTFQETQEQAAKEQATQAERGLKVNTYIERLQPLIDADPELNDKIESYERAGLITKYLESAVLDSPVGERITQHLVNNPADIQILAGLNEAQTYKAVGMLEVMLGGNQQGQNAGSRQTSAAAPISPVKSGAATKKDITDDDMPYEEWKKVREAQLRR